MASKNWQAGGKILRPALAVVCPFAMPLGVSRAASGDFAPPSYIGSMDPHFIWELLIGGIVVVSFLTAVALWVMSALRNVRRSQLRRNAFVSSALNNLSQGVVMTDPQKRIVFCNDRYLEIYGITRSDIRKDMTGPELLALRRKLGVLDMSTDDFYRIAGTGEGLITELPDGRSIVVKYWGLPNGGSVATHEDCSEQRRLSRQLATTTQFLESVIDNVPVCVAAKSIEDGRYILANRAFEKFSRLSRDQIVGKRADEIFKPATAVTIAAADRAAIESPDSQFRNEFIVERGPETRMLASNRVIARDDKGQPKFLIALFDDVTDHKSLSHEIPRTDRRQHSGFADRRARQRRQISARQPQRRNHSQPPPRGRHRPDRRGYFQCARSQADRGAR
jgi:PAS domain S-box-containing protein